MYTYTGKVELPRRRPISSCSRVWVEMAYTKNVTLTVVVDGSFPTDTLTRRKSAIAVPYQEGRSQLARVRRDFIRCDLLGCNPRWSWRCNYWTTSVPRFCISVEFWGPRGLVELWLRKFSSIYPSVERMTPMQHAIFSAINFYERICILFCQHHIFS